MLISNFLVLTTIGNDFVFGFIQAMDGEKVYWRIRLHS